MKKLATLLSVIIIAISSQSCTKEGKQGPAGAAGTNGNANVQEYTFLNQGFAYVAAQNDYEVNLNVPAITQSVVNSNAVIVYIQPVSNTSGWVAVPCTLGGVSFNVAYGVNQVLISIPSASTALYNAKVVII